MPKRDEGNHDLEYAIVVVGGASDTFTAALALKEGALVLGEVKGWTTRVRFHTFGVDPWASEDDAASLMKLLAEVDGVVLTDAPDQGRHYVSSALERLERALHLTRPQLPTVVFGGPALADEWASLTGVRPLFVADAAPDNALPAVKALARQVFRPSTRPPPPA